MMTKHKKLPKPVRKNLMKLDCAIATGDEREIKLSFAQVEGNFLLASRAITAYEERLSRIRRRLKWAAKRSDQDVAIFARELLELI